MGPVRGFKKRRRLVEKKPSSQDHNTTTNNNNSSSSNNNNNNNNNDNNNNSSASGSTLDDEGSVADWWAHFSKRINGSSTQSKGLDKFESVFKVSRKTFNYIFSLVKDDMLAKPSNFYTTNGKSLSIIDQVAIALRRLSSGESLWTVGELFGTSHSTVSLVTWRFVEIMEERGLRHLQWPTTEGEMTKIKSKFEDIRGLPNCCGAIDNTHILMCLPSVDPTIEAWFDREKNHSMILQAVVDPEMRFRDIVTGWPGSMSDALVLKSSGFFELCERGKRLDGEKVQLAEGSEVGEYIVGDVGFPLLPWLLTPYQGKDLSESKSEFNKRHFATRMVANRAFARLKEMWKIIYGVMWRPDKHKLPRIILVCCMLHNIIIDLEDEVQDEMSLSHHHDLNYRQQISDSIDKSASIKRDKLSFYLSGRLPA